VKKADRLVSKMAKELDVTRTLLQTILKIDLKMNSHKKQEVHGLIELLVMT
jgi:hypothetical protein